MCPHANRTYWPLFSSHSLRHIWLCGEAPTRPDIESAGALGCRISFIGRCLAISLRLVWGMPVEWQAIVRSFRHGIPVRASVPYGQPTPFDCAHCTWGNCTRVGGSVPLALTYLYAEVFHWVETALCRDILYVRDPGPITLIHLFHCLL